jgi:hypothetical protein
MKTLFGIPLYRKMTDADLVAKARKRVAHRHRHKWQLATLYVVCISVCVLGFVVKWKWATHVLFDDLLLTKVQHEEAAALRWPGFCAGLIGGLALVGSACWLFVLLLNHLGFSNEAKLEDLVVKLSDETTKAKA